MAGAHTSVLCVPVIALTVVNAHDLSIVCAYACQDEAEAHVQRLCALATVAEGGGDLPVGDLRQADHPGRDRAANRHDTGYRRRHKPACPARQ
jgi:hypothetical protein